MSKRERLTRIERRLLDASLKEHAEIALQCIEGLIEEKPEGYEHKIRGYIRLIESYYPDNVWMLSLMRYRPQFRYSEKWQLFVDTFKTEYHQKYGPKQGAVLLQIAYQYLKGYPQ
ncbi:MAG: hypothetical protein ACFB15_18895 [Cyclobacteriaceae bacterium]